MSRHLGLLLALALGACATPPVEIVPTRAAAAGDGNSVALPDETASEHVAESARESAAAARPGMTRRELDPER